MEDIELTELDTEILKQKLEVLEYDFEKICASYTNELEEFCKGKNLTEVDSKTDRFIKKLAKKYSEYLVPISEEMKFIEAELLRRQMGIGEEE